MWFDKACIDQRDIGENLACLPVFLAGCRKLLITCGTTWSERLWCVLEVFVHLQMGKGVDDIELLLLSDKPPPAAGEAAEEVAREELLRFDELFARFDVMRTSCYDVSQRERLLAIIEAGFGGAASFNEAMRAAMDQLRKRAIADNTQEHLFFDER